MRRNTAVECIRVLAIVGVIFAHTTGIRGSVSPVLLTRFTYHLSSFGVVFFFITAGYFWGKKIRAGKQLGQAYASYVSRILNVFALFSLIYLCVSDEGILAYAHHGLLCPLKICYWNVQHLIGGPGPLRHSVLSLFMTGTKYHLWFLVALIWATSITAIMVKLRRESLLLWLGLILYLFEASSLFLSDTTVGFSLPFNPKHGPFFGAFFFAVGYRLSSRQGTFSLKPAIALLSAGFAILIIDMLFVRNHLGFMVVQPFLQVTIGLGATLLALARPSLGADSVLASSGKYVLGVYLVHPFLIDSLQPIGRALFPAPILEFWLTAMVFLCSILVVLIMQRTPVLRSFVGSPAVSITR